MVLMDCCILCEALLVPHFNANNEWWLQCPRCGLIQRENEYYKKKYDGEEYEDQEETGY